jgi:hypothetical protein
VDRQREGAVRKSRRRVREEKKIIIVTGPNNSVV